MRSTTSIEFQRESSTPDGFDGRWRVWIGTRCFGVVRKSADPIKKHEAWGYESKPFGRYPNGVTCETGYRTRIDAAFGLVEKVELGR